MRTARRSKAAAPVGGCGTGEKERAARETAIIGVVVAAAEKESEAAFCVLRLHRRPGQRESLMKFWSTPNLTRRHAASSADEPASGCRF